MIDFAGLSVGDLVHYQPEHYGVDKWENGIIKEIRIEVRDAVWVVYHCAGRWGKFKDYTGAKTNLRDLKSGWKHGEPVERHNLR